MDIRIQILFLRISLMLGIMLGSIHPALAVEEIPADGSVSIEAALLERINDARRSPLAAAASLGLDPQSVFDRLPALQPVLVNGIQPLVRHDLLAQAAKKHTDEMIAESYYSHQSADGRGPEDRIADTGYAAEQAGEQLSIVTFRNYMPKEQAVELLFRSLLLEELDPASQAPRYILNPDISEIGIGAGAGLMRFRFGRYNAYLVTCNFAQPEQIEFTAAEAAEMRQLLIQLVNQARVRPLAVLAANGVNPDALFAERPELAVVLENGLSPLGTRPELKMSTERHLNDMRLNQFAGVNSSDGASLESRMADAGYAAVSAGVRIEVLDLNEYVSPVDAAGKIFACILQKDLAGDLSEMKIFNPAFRDVGVAVGSGSMPEPALRRGAGFFVFDFGESRGNDKTHVSGVVYADRNGDGLFSPGEGVAARNIIVYDGGPHLRTDAAGGFGAFIDPAWYWVILFSQEEPLVIKETDLRTDNHWVEFQVSLN